MVEKLKEVVEDEDLRREIYETLYDAMVDKDWDCQSDTVGIDPLWDRVMGYYPEEED